jgi:hypothetical protein
MSILNVNQIQPVGSGQTVTISATNIDTGSATFTGSSSATFNNGLNVTGGSVGIGTDNPASKLEVYGTSASTVSAVNGTGRYRGFEILSSGTRTAYYQDDSTDNAARLFTTRNDLIFGTGDTERARFNSSGNLVFSTSGTGIDFSATSDAAGMTSELLDDYEEGTWTPTFGSLTVSSPTATYTKVGRTVSLYIGFTPSTTGTWASMNNFTITNLPFTPSGNAVGWCVFSMAATQQAHFLGSGGSTMYFVCTATAANVNKNIFAPLRVVYNV